ncbi:MAG: ABC transporter permease [Rhodobacteraceae bacterium]|nr:ABC transporter permease [Paracoccaceae bacterium]
MHRLLAALGGVALWQGVVQMQLLPPFVLPSPWAVLRALGHNGALLADHGAVTLAEVLAGLVLGVILGLISASAMALSPALRAVGGPVLAASQALPVFVLAPVLTIWFGYGPAPKVAMTVLLVFFPVASGVLDGLMATPQGALDLARIADAGRGRSFIWLRWPHALPHLGAALRISVTYAPTGAVIGEWVGASKGLGYLMLMANARSKIDLMFAALVLIVALTLALRMITDRILRRFAI